MVSEHQLKSQRLNQQAKSLIRKRVDHQSPLANASQTVSPSPIPGSQLSPRPLQTRKKGAQFAALENIDKGTFKNALEVCREDEQMLFGGKKQEKKPEPNQKQDQKEQSSESNERPSKQKLLGEKRTRRVNQQFEDEFRKLSLKEQQDADNDASADEVQMETDKDHKCSQPDE